MNGPIYRDQAVLQAVIPAGSAESGEIPLRHFVLWGVVVPPMTGAELTFRVTPSLGGEYQDLYDDLGQPVTLPVAPATARCYTLPAALAAWPACRIVSSAVEGAQRQFTLVAKG